MPTKFTYALRNIFWALNRFADSMEARVQAHLNSCVHCGLCAETCHYYLSTGDERYMPANKVEQLARLMANITIADQSQVFNTAKVEAFELENLLAVALATIHSAHAREESRGAHSRTDHPRRDDEDWLKHTMAHKNDDGVPGLSYKSVNIDWEKFIYPRNDVIAFLEGAAA